MKVSCLYHQGSASRREDGMFLCSPFFGVVDGVSAPHGPKHPQRMFAGMTGGELVARTIESQAQKAAEEFFVPDLQSFVNALNESVGGIQIEVPDDAGELAGATFAVAKVGDDTIGIAQGGDAFALWELKDGTIGMTPNQVRAHDAELNAVLNSHLRQTAKDFFGMELELLDAGQLKRARGEAFDRANAQLKEARRQDVNRYSSPRGYALLNGQLCEQMVFGRSFPKSMVKTLLLITDGMVPWEAMKGRTAEQIAEQVFASFKKGGLAHLLNWARGIEARVANVHYTDAAEATGIALEFAP